ncbi:MAG: DUF4268 domain-containing protein [Actinobacteria bacterium]|nr:DUF4268 domain-containing protein [Actinomycetota bacterium]
MELGRIERLDLRTVWPHEAHSLTPWLLANADVLADVLGIDLELTAAEHGVGSFALDLIGRDLTNDCVLIVENQLTPTDHDHLGKLITYAAGTDAQTVVWLAPSFREEHREALDLLNNLGGERVRFFGIELGAIRIGDSVPAPLLELRVEPNDWHAQLSAVARGVSQGSGKPALYLEFWSRFLDRVREERPGWTRAKKPGSSNWFAMACPFKGGPYYAVSFAQGGKLRCELYIDYADGDAVAALYSNLLARRERIEAIYGTALSWEALPDRRASRIGDYTDGDVTNTDSHDQYIDWFFDSGRRLREAINDVAGEVVGGAALDMA